MWNFLLIYFLKVHPSVSQNPIDMQQMMETMLTDVDSLCTSIIQREIEKLKSNGQTCQGRSKFLIYFFCLLVY